MFNSLKKLFGSTEKAVPAASLPTSTPAPLPAPWPDQSRPPPTPIASAFLCREAVFDRKNRLAGRLFRLQASSAQANAGAAQQRQFDQTLLDTLNASPDAWNTSLAFVPLSSSSLELAAVDRLKTTNLVLLVQLAEDADPNQLALRLETLRQRGLAIGIFRQPKNPAFTPAIAFADYGCIDVGANEADTIRDFSAAFRASKHEQPTHLFGGNIDTLDEQRFCHQWHFDYFHGQFASTCPSRPNENGADPHKVQLLHLLRLVQGEAETNEIVAALKQDPLLAFRVLRYLNSPALGLNHRIDSLAQALVILGRQRLARWLSVLLFSVHEPNFSDWLLVESALTRGRLMEVLGTQLQPNEPHDPLFLTGIFSCLGRLLRRPLAELLDDMPLSENVRAALLEARGPYAGLLAIAEASDVFDLPRMESTARAAGIDPDTVNSALLAATAWASEVTEHWE
ncbi:MAG TPA: HDOD domain-containing protein [Azonexus sp.]|nr:HDOD domain-containing protein [Azonexus sp.]